jgi:AcrR family transcriptional regulator
LASTVSRRDDRRVQRTRRALRDALISMLPERVWDEVSVRDICERANVGRSTFYMHFQDKEQLLAGALSDLHATLREQADAAKKGSRGEMRFVRGLIEHAHEQRKLFRSVVGRRSGHVVQTRFRRMVLQLTSEELSLFIPAGWQREATAHYVSGALVELLAWWVDGRSARSIDEIERLFHQLTMPALARLKGSSG